MATPVPVLVKAYSTNSPPFGMLRSHTRSKQSLPPISSYAFADILREADSKDFQQAIDGIAEICAKNRLSLADEYGSHLPPLGEITSANASSTLARPQVLRPGMRRALTSVPEASSGSSEGSRGSKTRGNGLFGFGKAKEQAVPESLAPKRMRIGSMGRSITVAGTTAMASSVEFSNDESRSASATVAGPSGSSSIDGSRQRPTAVTSLQRLLDQTPNSSNG